jgi:hypothetical protein
LLTGSINRLAKAAAGRPPSAKPRWCTIQSSLAVRRARAGSTSPNRSAKICRRQCGTSQTNRREITWSFICRPAQGKSATCRMYRLWIRRDTAPHNGHSASSSSDLTTRIIESDESLTVSTTNPLGTSDEIWMPVLMLLIPPFENRELASQYHQM